MFLDNFSKNHKQKNHHQTPASKTTCCLNSTPLSHSGHFYSIPWKLWTNPPPIFCNVIWHVVNFDLRIFVSWFTLRITNRKIITRYLWKMLTFIFCVFWCLLRFKKYHHQNQNGKRWQGLKSAPSVSTYHTGNQRKTMLMLCSCEQRRPRSALLERSRTCCTSGLLATIGWCHFFQMSIELFGTSMSLSMNKWLCFPVLRWWPLRFLAFHTSLAWIPDPDGLQPENRSNKC